MSYPYGKNTGKVYKTELLYEEKYQFLMNKREKVSLRHFEDDPEAFIEYSNNIQDV